MSGDAPAQLGNLEGFEVQVGGAGIDAGEFEKVEDHPVEAADLADDHLDSLAGTFGHFVAANLEHLCRRGEGGDRSAQLVADVGGESRFPLDPRLNRIGHRVERVDDRGEVGVRFRCHSGVEIARGDVAGGDADAVERAEQPATRPHADRGGEQRDHGGTDHQREQQHPQCLFGVVDREGLEVLGVDVGERDADPEVEVSLERESLQSGDVVLDGRLELGRHGIGNG